MLGSAGNWLGLAPVGFRSASHIFLFSFDQQVSQAGVSHDKSQAPYRARQNHAVSIMSANVLFSKASNMTKHTINKTG